MNTRSILFALLAGKLLTVPVRAGDAGATTLTAQDIDADLDLEASAFEFHFDSPVIAG